MLRLISSRSHNFTSLSCQLHYCRDCLAYYLLGVPDSAAFHRDKKQMISASPIFAASLGPASEWYFSKVTGLSSEDDTTNQWLCPSELL